MSADLFAAFAETQDVPVKSEASVKSKDHSNRGFGPLIDGLDDFPQAKLETRSNIDHHKGTDSLWEKDTHGKDVLFDASGFQESDDFGDFEDVEESGQQHWNSNPTSIPSISHQNTRKPTQQDDSVLIDFSASPEQSTHVPPTSTTPVTPKPGANFMTLVTSSWSNEQGMEEDDWGDFEDVKSLKSAQKPTPICTKVEKTLPKADEELDFDDWQPFEDGDPQTIKEQASSKGPEADQRPIQKTGRILAEQKPTSNAPTVSSDRPTNVPPPAILLELLPSILQNLTDVKLQQEDVLLETATRILTVYRVSARIIAGRSLRWKRDTILAQSTKISQAGKTGGMKLAAVNKGESVKEEKEAAETVMVWSRYTHKYNSILTKAKLQHSPMKLSSTMPVKTATGPSSMDAPHVCPICGLKRIERVGGVDIDVSDVFGEFWIEHWGHKECSDFWYTFKELLGQR